MGNKFNFFVPATISKSVDENGVEEMFLEGVASDPSKDIEGESLNPKGFEIDYFLQNGLLKFEHGKDPKSYIGEPVEAKVTRNNEFYIKGRLWKNSQMARDTYELAETLEKSGSNRRMGWSIEGNATATDPNNKAKITKAKITNVVLTMNPVNVNTWATISKSLNQDITPEIKETLYIQPQYDEVVDECLGGTCLLDITHEGVQFKLDKEFNLTKSVVTKKMAVKDLVEEHEQLVDVLETGSEKDIEEEAKKQKKELREYKEDLEKAVSDDTLTTITIKCRQPDNSLKDLIEYIGQNGNTGHSFSIVVDPDGGKGQKKTFGWDGDGSDYIKSVEVTEPKKIEKDMNTENGAALTREDVEGMPKNLEGKSVDCIKKSITIIVNAVEHGLIGEENLEKIRNLYI